MRSDSTPAAGAAPPQQTIEIQDPIGTGWHAVIFLAALAAVFSRLPGALLHPQFFAEDGWLWYQQAYNLHWLRSLETAYAGQLQTLPRLVTGVALLFPMQWAPLIMNLAGAVIQVLPVTALLSSRCKTWGSLPRRILMAILYLALPNVPEVHIVITDAMWHLALLQAVLAFSTPPVSWRGKLADVVVFSVGGLSGPFCIVLLPCVMAWWWIRRQRWTLIVLGVLLLDVMIQGLVILQSVKRPGASLGATPGRLLRIIAGNIFIDSMAGSGGPNLRSPLLLLALAGGLAILVWGWRSATLAGRLFMVFAVLVLTASLRDPLLLPGPIPRWEVLANASGIRYWFMPSLMFLWAAAWCVTQGGSKLARYAGWVVVLLSLVGVYRKWVYPPWPPGHFRADVERFKTLKRGQSMIFDVYDPGERKMELVKR